MILVTGGLASGKRTYVLSLGYTQAQIGTKVDGPEPVLYGLDEALRAGPLSRDDLEGLVNKDVVVCCEVGLGVVPVDKDERAWRELVGRTCCELSARASSVVRLICGIPVRIKDSTKGAGAPPSHRTMNEE